MCTRVVDVLRNAKALLSYFSLCKCVLLLSLNALPERMEAANAAAHSDPYTYHNIAAKDYR
ncbi:MAG: hypothetical protein L0Z73_03100 [Gammaproteobacteria bacterium]|nr:hypothetical protein [Gammaproteobacteria bacterium]